MHSSRVRTAHSSSRLLGSVCLSACWDQTPPGCGPGDPRGRSSPQTPAPGVGSNKILSALQ